MHRPCAAVISDLKEAGVRQSVVNSVMNSMVRIVQDIQQHAKETVIRHLLANEGETEMCMNVEACFEELKNLFTFLNS